ncbi:MAG: CatB-related O-acetyltransferase [Lactobacillaceae bacterium]|jgi:acetyltransferase-like isoleucine patch superfamily enzyme|nr:CatB-related O-acetyltransferase [Lactobacillaceae bacterium]
MSEFDFIVNHYYSYGKRDATPYTNQIHFWEDGFISGYHHPNEFRWELKSDDEFVIFSESNQTTNTFRRDGHNWFSENGHQLIAQPDDFSPRPWSDFADKHPNQKVGKHVYGKIELASSSYAENPNVLEIGNFVSIADYVLLVIKNHAMDQVSTYPFMSTRIDPSFKKTEPVYLDRVKQDHVPLGTTKIGNDVWIGDNVVLMGGITIGDGAVIGAGAFVNKDVPPYAVVAGVPARVIKYRFSPEQIQELEKIQWWNWSDEDINRNLSDFNTSGNIEEFIQKYKNRE